ncbi:MAG: hypothetical protein BWY28_02737 [bacterium ADurb.Bin236]|nr:MAG: hypothetical protein BWY28_02737 [bacterium ADurb.Bin236]
MPKISSVVNVIILLPRMHDCELGGSAITRTAVTSMLEEPAEASAELGIAVTGSGLGSNTMPPASIAAFNVAPSANIPPASNVLAIVYVT